MKSKAIREVMELLMDLPIESPEQQEVRDYLIDTTLEDELKAAEQREALQARTLKEAFDAASAVIQDALLVLQDNNRTFSDLQRITTQMHNCLKAYNRLKGDQS